MFETDPISEARALLAEDDAQDPIAEARRLLAEPEATGAPAGVGAEVTSLPRKARGDEMTVIDRATRTLRAAPGVPEPFGPVLPPEPSFLDRMLTRLRGAELPGGKTPVAPGTAVNPKTGLPIPEAPLGTVPVLDTAAVGLPQVGRGLRGLVAAPGGALVESGIPGVRASVPTERAPLLNAASDVVEGAFKVGEPLMAAGALTNPLTTAAALGLGLAGQAGAQKGAEALGAPEDVSRFAGNVGALLAGGLGAKGGHAAQGRLAANRLAGPVARALEAELTKPAPPVQPRLVKRPQPLVRPVEPRVEPAGAEARPPVPAPQERPAVPVAVQAEPPVVSEARKLIAEEVSREPLPVGRPAEVDVREPSGDGRALGVGDAEGREAPGARQPVPVEEGATGAPRPEAKAPIVSPRGHAVDTAVETRLPVAAIKADPGRFQFKQNVDTAGVRGEDRLTESWDPDKAGVLLVWRDPADGQTYVVNGHHRLDLAKRAGQPDVLARYVDAPDANAAMIKGAEVNIAEGRGTAVDAGRVYRTLSPDDRASRIEHAKTSVARDGMALANLTDEAFRQVAVGEMPLARGLAIGRAKLAPAEEASLLKLLAAQDAKGRAVSEGTIRELVDEVRQAPTVDVTGTGEQRNIFEDIFGDQTVANTAFERARVRAALQERLARDARLFGYVTKGDRAERLAGAGKTRIDVEAAGQRASEASTISDVFSRLANTKGPINDAINAAAESLAKGGRYRDLESDLYARVRDAVDVELRAGPPVAPADAGGLRGGRRPSGGPPPPRPAPPEGRTEPVVPPKPAPPLPVKAAPPEVSEFPKTEKPAPPVAVMPGGRVHINIPGPNGPHVVSGHVERVLPDGRVEVKTLDHGYHTVRPSEFVEGKPIRTRAEQEAAASRPAPPVPPKAASAKPKPAIPAPIYAEDLAQYAHSEHHSLAPLNTVVRLQPKDGSLRVANKAADIPNGEVWRVYTGRQARQIIEEGRDPLELGYTHTAGWRQVREEAMSREVHPAAKAEPVSEPERILSEMKATTDKAAPPVAEVPFSLAREAKKAEPVQNDLLVRIQSIEDGARERLKKRGTFSGNRVSSGLPVDDMADLAVIGAAKIAKGAVQFSQWSAEMVREFGEVVKPHLAVLYKEAKLKAESFGPMPIYAPSGRELPATKPIPAARRLEFPSVQKMPEPIRQDIADLMERYEGFEAQRRGVQTWERTEERAKDVWLPLETLKPGRAVNAEELASYKNAIATALTQRKPLLAKIKDGTATDWDRLQASHLTDVATVLTASYRGAKAEAGRALNILRAKARVLELQESAFLEAALKAPGFQADLTRISKAALEAEGDPIAQLRILRQRSGTWFDYAQAAYYTSLLSGVKTQLRNIIGNSFNLVANTLVPIGAAPADVALSKARGTPRSVYLGEIPHSTAGAWIGLGRGARNGLFVLRHGFRPSTVEAAAEGKFDTPRVELPGGLVTNFPTRLLEGMDEFFRAIARSQELHAGAYAQARREGLTRSDQIGARMSELMTATDPKTPDGKVSADLFRKADEFAARAVFQEEPGPIVQWLLKAKGPSSPLPLRAASMFIAPFVKTPSAILRQGAEWSPLGAVMKGVREGKGRQQSQAVGRAALGSAGLISAAYLASNDLLTGAPPSNPGEREEFYAQGKLSNAVKIGPFWVRYSLFQPFSVGLAAVANAWQSFKASEMDDAAAEEAMVAAVAGAGASLLDQSFLSGLGTMIDAVNDPQRSAGRWLSLFAQGLVPGSGLLRNVTQATDQTYRKPKGVEQSVKTILPGLSKDVPPRRTRFGEPATRPGSWATRGFVVPEVSRAVDDDITATLARLDVRPPVPTARYTVKGKPVELTTEQQDVVVEATGRERKTRVERIIRSAVFGSLPEDSQRLALKRAIDTAGEDVRTRVLAALREKRPLEVSRLVSAQTREKMDRERRDFQALVEGRENRP